MTGRESTEVGLQGSLTDPRKRGRFHFESQGLGVMKITSTVGKVYGGVSMKTELLVLNSNLDFPSESTGSNGD